MYLNTGTDVGVRPGLVVSNSDSRAKFLSRTPMSTAKKTQPC
jgi:hypothetical protein